MSKPTPPPRFATARNPAYESYGWRVRKVARVLGTPLMPWQSEVVDVAREVDEAGLPRYPLVIVSVPRQAGKTTLVLANGVDRSLFAPRAKIWHTAQTGQDARTKFLEMAEPFAVSALGKGTAELKRGAGNTRLVFTNGSTFQPHPPTVDALHGEQSDLNDIDEAWSFDEARGAALLQAIIPTQATRPAAQTWITSTMGTADSTWFHDLSDRGRLGEPGIAYFEWSIADDVDPMDLDAVAAAHPAYGHTIDMRALERAAAQFGDTPGGFARAYGNRRTAAAERVIPVDAVIRATTDEAVPDGRPAFGVAVSWDRDETAIVAVVLDEAGTPWVEVIDVRPGVSWAVDACETLSRVHSGALVGVDPVGPSASLADKLDLRQVPTYRMRTADVTAAADDLLNRLTETYTPAVRFRRDSSLINAMDRASRRMIGDGAWTWGRRTSSGSIAALEAASHAVHLSVRAPGPAQKPVIYLG